MSRLGGMAWRVRAFSSQTAEQLGRLFNFIRATAEEGMKEIVRLIDLSASSNFFVDLLCAATVQHIVGTFDEQKEEIKEFQTILSTISVPAGRRFTHSPFVEAMIENAVQQLPTIKACKSFYKLHSVGGSISSDSWRNLGSWDIIAILITFCQFGRYEGVRAYWPTQRVVIVLPAARGSN